MFLLVNIPKKDDLSENKNVYFNFSSLTKFEVHDVAPVIKLIFGNFVCELRFPDIHARVRGLANFIENIKYYQTVDEIMTLAQLNETIIENSR
mgnify:CR=1 FL=1